MPYVGLKLMGLLSNPPPTNSGRIFVSVKVGTIELSSVPLIQVRRNQTAERRYRAKFSGGS